MNTKRDAAWWIIIFLVLLSWGCSKAPLPTETITDNQELEKEFSKIIISSTDYEGQDVDSAEVYWDGEFVGYTPYSKENVEAGIHALRIQKKGFEIYTESISINQTQSVYIEVLLTKMSINKGQLFITINMDSVITVLSNDKNEVVDLFYSREKKYVLDPGGYFLRAERIGYRLFLKAIEIQVDSIVIQNIQMEKLENIELPDVVLAVPDSGIVNQPFIISWESNNAERVDIDYVENPGLNGKRELVFQLAGKKYIKAKAYNNSGSTSVIDSIYISNPVEDPKTQPTIDLDVYPRMIKVSESATIKWKSLNATSVAIDYVANAGLDGARQVNFDTPGSYKIEAYAYGAGGTAVDYDSLLVVNDDEPIVDLPVIELFIITPDSILERSTAVLHWEVTGDNVQVLIDQGIGEVGLVGNKNVSPSENTIYTIFATNDRGTVHKSVELKVTKKTEPVIDAPKINTFIATPDSISEDETAVLHWEVTGENVQVIIDQGIGEVGLVGNKNVSPSENTIYTIFATNDRGTVHKSVELKVTKKTEPVIDAPKINTFIATPDSISEDETAVLHWEVTGENVQVIIDQGIGEVGKTGNQNIAPEVDATYTLTASNSAGSASLSTYLRVGTKNESKVNPPLLDFSVTPKTVEYGDPVSITWDSDGYQVIIDQGIGVRGPSGTEDVYFENPGLKVFTAVAYGTSQEITTIVDSVFVNEPEQLESPIVFLAVVDSVEVGKPALIEWHSQNSDRVDVDYVQAPGLNGKAEVIFYSEGTREITATAYNQAGQATVTQQIEVVFSSIQQQVLPIYISSQSTVGAIHHSLPQVVKNAGHGVIVQGGYYQVNANAWYNSGDYQKNESFFIVIKDENGNYIYPQDRNAGLYKVVKDDAGAPHVKKRNAGLFYLNTGNFTIELHHYYTISNLYPQFIVGNSITGAESIQVISFELKYRQP